MSIENITEKILSEANESSQQVMEKAKIQGEELIAKATATAQDILEKSAQKAKEDAVVLKNRKLSVAQLESRKMQLAAKQEGVAKSFDLALEKLANMGESEYIAFLSNLIADIAQDGAEILLNPKDRAAVGEKITTLLQAMGKTVTLSEETIKAKGGFVLRNGNIEMNATLETIVNAVKEDAVPALVKGLFE